MNIQEFKEKAEQGGWKGKVHDTCENCKESMMSSCSSNYERMLLDPKAWKATGKVEGWEDVSEIAKQTGLPVHTYQIKWRTSMHQMIDVLIEGKSIEDYLAEL